MCWEDGNFVFVEVLECLLSNCIFEDVDVVVFAVVYFSKKDTCVCVVEEDRCVLGSFSIRKHLNFNLSEGIVIIIIKHIDIIIIKVVIVVIVVVIQFHIEISIA